MDIEKIWENSSFHEHEMWLLIENDVDRYFELKDNGPNIPIEDYTKQAKSERDRNKHLVSISQLKYEDEISNMFLKP